MRTLIIGGTGLISTGITRLLAERGHDVTLYNRGNRPAHGGRTQRVIQDGRRGLQHE